MKRFVLLQFLFAASLPSAAHATGNADCSIEEPGLNVTFEALYGYGGTGELLQNHASIALTDPKSPPGNWTFDLDGSALEQQWVVGDEFKVLLYKEHEGADMVLEIQARRTAPEDIAFDGTYRLIIGPSDGSLFSRAGKVACSMG
jgi:hypothetical protein